MKHLFILLALSLVSCVYTWSDSPSSDIKERPIPMIHAHGTDGINNWNCEVKDMNPQLVWVECKFVNTWGDIAGRSTASTCIRVRFFDEKSNKLIVESRKLCSGALRVEGTSVNYVAFTNQDREALNNCGPFLGSCVMLAGNDNK
jgi:hypothetical protein